MQIWVDKRSKGVNLYAFSKCGHDDCNLRKSNISLNIGGKMAKSLQQRQEEARNRIISYNKLSPADKLKLIRSRRGKSKKEESKILKTIKENQ